MSKRVQKTMRIFLERNLSDYCQITVKPHEAQAVIVDADGYHAEEELQRHLLQFPQQQVVLLSITPEKYGQEKNRLLVPKPLDTAAFADTLRQLQQHSL
ncbi:MAG: hypothetical protein Q4A11_05775, partial [Brachymonas sp.]|nr:hypothetical protein [Brachymonas sp.]